jgi:hypothetical protein
MEYGTPPVGELEEVYQEDPPALLPMPVVEVKVSGPVEMHQIGSVSGGMRSFVLAMDEVKKICGDDPRRRIVRLIADQDFCVGIDQNSVATEYATQWPAGVPLEITHVEELWVKFTILGGTLSMVAENWAG